MTDISKSTSTSTSMSMSSISTADKSTTRQHVYTRISAFTTNYRGGNPAGVVILPSLSSISNINTTQDDGKNNNNNIFLYDDIEWMSSVAIEMNMSETAFIRSLDANNDKKQYSIRWFLNITGDEEKLCGHATLSAAYTLYTKGYVHINTPIEFHSRYSGTLYAKAVIHGNNSKDNNNNLLIELDFPAKPSVNTIPINQFDSDLLHALTLTPDDIVNISEHTPDLLIEVKSSDIIFNADHVDFKTLKKYPQYRGVIVTAKAMQSSAEINRTANRKVDFVSRFYCAQIGEDPVTGSAHCELCCYWTEKLKKQNQQLIGYQASARGGIVLCEWKGDRVILQGNAVTVIDGYLMV